jgi:hypothetical protein
MFKQKLVSTVKVMIRTVHLIQRSTATTATLRNAQTKYSKHVPCMLHMQDKHLLQQRHGETEARVDIIQIHQTLRFKQQLVPTVKVVLYNIQLHQTLLFNNSWFQQ